MGLEFQAGFRVWGFGFLQGLKCRVCDFGFQHLDEVHYESQLVGEIGNAIYRS